ncbi:MAG: hypothetical protein KY449_04610 [Proteobacteria bacterium]|nr:hypothetical protein [Pseudomonadota bacterium]
MASGGDRSVLGAGRGKTAAGAVWILFILGPFTGGLTALAGWIVTVTAKGGAEGLARDHMHRQGRLFWTAVLFAAPLAVISFIGWITRIVLIGYPIGWLAAVGFFVLSAWFVLTSFFGLLRLQQDRLA